MSNDRIDGKKPKGTNEVFKVLLEAAQNMCTVVYEDIDHQVFSPQAKGDVCRQALGYIRDWCLREGLPKLNVLAVGKHSRRASEGVTPELRAMYEMEWRLEVLRTYMFAWNMWAERFLRTADGE